MSKAAKKRNHDRRRDEKRKRKMANATKYTSDIGTAKNSKDKTGVQLISKMPGHPHKNFCGNIGCSKCFPMVNLKSRY